MDIGITGFLPCLFHNPAPVGNRAKSAPAPKFPINPCRMGNQPIAPHPLHNPLPHSHPPPLLNTGHIRPRHLDIPPRLASPSTKPQEQTRFPHSPIPMPDLILASTSAIRLQLLQNAGLSVTAFPARIDEDALRQSLTHDQASPRDIADALAEAKAHKLAQRHPDALVLGCDQILALNTRIFTKPATLDDARTQLQTLRAQTHSLLSAAVLYHNAQPIWRHIGTAHLTMRPFTDQYLDAYLTRQWPAVSQSVGGYLLESEGIQLFSAIEGDYFTILGLPLLPFLNYLTLRGFIPS